MIYLAQKIEQLTKEKGITGKELGIMLNLKKSPLTDWKNGKAKPTLEQIIKICDIFGISSDELLDIKSNNILSEQEKQLLNYFRQCSDGNKLIILNAAQGLMESKEEKSSTLKIG